LQFLAVSSITQKMAKDSKRRVTHEIWAKHMENGERQGKNAENGE